MITYSVILLSYYCVQQNTISILTKGSFTCQCAAAMLRLRFTYVMDYFLSDNYAAMVYPFYKLTCLSYTFSFYLQVFWISIRAASSMREPYSFHFVCFSACEQFLVNIKTQKLYEVEI